MFKGMVGGDRWFGDVLLSPAPELRGSVIGVFTRMAFTGRNATAPRTPATQHPVSCPLPHCFLRRAVPSLRYLVSSETSFQSSQVFEKRKRWDKYWRPERIDVGVLQKRRSLDCIANASVQRMAQMFFRGISKLIFFLTKF